MIVFILWAMYNTEMKFVLEAHAYSPKMIIFSFIGIICVHLSHRQFF